MKVLFILYIVLILSFNIKPITNLIKYDFGSKGRYLLRDDKGYLRISSDNTNAFTLKGMSSSNFMTAPLIWFSETSIKTLKGWRANAFRICFCPTYWKEEKEGIMKYNSEKDLYELIEDSYNKYINKLFQVMDRFLSNEIYIIVNWHTLYQGYYNNHYLYTHQNIAKKFFIDVSNAYPNNPYVIYEINNEDPEEWISIYNYANYIIPSIREISPDSLIIVGTPDLDGSPNKIETDPNNNGYLNYPNIAYAFHIYPNGKVNWESSSFEEAIEKDIPIIVTEWSSSAGANSYNEVFALNFINILKNYAISWLNYAWSEIDVNGNEFAIANANQWDEKLPDEVLCRNGKLIKYIFENYEKNIEIPTDGESMKILNRMISRKWEGLIWKEEIINGITSIIFETKKSISKYDEKFNLGDTYGNNIIGYLIENKYSTNDDKYYDLHIQANGKIYANKDCSNLFRAFSNVNYIDLTNFVVTNETTNIAMMFYGLGSTQYTKYTIVNNFTLIIGEDFNTSNIEDMSSLFEDLGSRSNIVNINLGKAFNTIRVKNMKKMFKNCGGYDKHFTLDLSNFYFDSNCSYDGIFDKWNNRNRTIYVKDEKMKDFILEKLANNTEKTYVIIKENNNEDDVPGNFANFYQIKSHKFAILLLLIFLYI